MNGVVIEDFKRIARDTLLGFARVRMPSGMVFHDVLICRREADIWAAPPSKPMLGRDGAQIRRDGKPAWQPVVSFATKQARDQFSGAIIDALRQSYPEALG